MALSFIKAQNAYSLNFNCCFKIFQHRNTLSCVYYKYLNLNYFTKCRCSVPFFDIQFSFCSVKKQTLQKNVSSFSTCSFLLKKKGKDFSKKLIAKEEDSESFLEAENFEEEHWNSLIAKSIGSLSGISSLAVLQPWIKWGKKKRYETSPDILLDEACALVKSIPSVDVSYKENVSVQNISKTRIFGSGTLERLADSVRKSDSQAVFINVDRLSRVQKSELEEIFGRKVFDRYFIVLSIFKHHARTAEAKLQIAIAELPFMSKRLLNEKDKLMLDHQISNLKASLKRLSERRERVRRTRQKISLSSVAVVGYTNCGKTTLIRALTGDEKVKGENRLFATLDVTAHKGCLPCGLEILYLDSVGFIQDIPTSLIASFNATLQDAIYADVVVFVRDLSHPNIVGQIRTVEKTLKDLPLPEETPIVVVNNKIDLIKDSTIVDESLRSEGIPASAITGKGLDKVLESIEKELLKVSGRKIYKLRLLTGSPKIEWLKQNVAVSSEELDEVDPQFTLVHVVINEAEKAAFRRAFRSDVKNL